MLTTKYELDPRLVELVKIDAIEKIHHVNGIDIEVEDDHTFTLSSGIISHNSAAKAIISAKSEKNAKFIGSFPLKGKPLNVNDLETKRLVENKEFKNLMIVTGLKLGEEVTGVEDGKWVEIEIDGEKMIANEFDRIFHKGKEIIVKDLL